MENRINISTVIPLFNEEENIEVLYSRLRNSLEEVTDSFEMIFINDGSIDATIYTIKELAKQDKKVKYICLSRNFGHQVAISAGLDKCRGEAVVIIDGDLQDPPELIPDLYQKYKEGFQVVYAKRKKRNGESAFKTITAKLFYRVLKKVTSFEIPLDTGDYRLIDRQIVEILKRMPEQNKFLRGQISWIGFRQSFVEFERDERKYGETEYPFKKMVKFALDGITSLSHRPLEFVTQAGFVVSFLSFLILLYAVYSHFILERTITGWTSLIISVVFIGGIQLLSIGIIGEYISRINKNVIKRPLYIVEESNI